MTKTDFSMKLGKLLEEGMNDLSTIDLIGILEITKLSLLKYRMEDNGETTQ